MLRENTYATFWPKNCYIFIKFGSKWIKRHDNESRSSYISSLVSSFGRLIRAVFNAFPLGYLIPVVSS